jgi:hypothetical protein
MPKTKQFYDQQFGVTIKNQISKVLKLIKRQPNNQDLAKRLDKLKSSSGRIKKKPGRHVSK